MKASRRASQSGRYNPIRSTKKDRFDADSVKFWRGSADSDEDAQAFRFDGALDSDMMSPRAGASLAGDWWHR